MKRSAAILTVGILLLTGCFAALSFALAATPAPSATPGRDYPVLSYGSSGEAVLRLQRALRQLGYLSDTADGVYGANTRQAVKDFQYMNGLKSDGVAGVYTQRLLYEGKALPTMPPDGVMPLVTVVPTPVPEAASVTLRYTDQFGNILYEEKRTVYETTVFTAEDRFAPEGSRLKSSRKVMVLYTGGRAYPAVAEFRYLSPIVPDHTDIPVYYLYFASDGTRQVLYESSMRCDTGSVVTVEADLSLVPGYRLISASRLWAVSDEMANTAPLHLDFVFEKEEGK